MIAIQLVFSVLGTILLAHTIDAISVAKQEIVSAQTYDASSRFYLTKNAAHHAQAKEDCESVGFKLATLPDVNEIADSDFYAKLLDMHVEKVWIGAELKNKDDCIGNSEFKNECWQWNGFNGNIDYQNETAVPWDPEVYSKPVSPSRRAYFNIEKLNLNLEDNTSQYRTLCEKPGFVPTV